MSRPDAVIVWLRHHPDVIEQVQALGEAQRGAQRVLDGLVEDGERRRQQLACCDHLWCGVRAAVAEAIDQPNPPGVAAEIVAAERERAGRAEVAGASIHAAAEYVWDASLAAPFGQDGRALRRALAILAALNCPDVGQHDAAVRPALEEIRS